MTDPSSSPPPSSKYLGISFDVEHTLLVYCEPTRRDSKNYVAALQVWAQEQQRRAGADDQEGATATAAAPPLPIPSWESDQDRERCFKEAWAEATKRAYAVRVSESGNNDPAWILNWERGLLAPWHRATREQISIFFADVVKLFFGWNAHTMMIPNAAALIDSYVEFLVHKYYVSRSVYKLPSSVSLLAEIKRAHPTLPLCVVSNTDSRARDALLLFDEYRHAFGTIVTASEVELLKPSAAGIREVMRRSNTGVGPDDPTQCKRWLHVGDEEWSDGGAARAAGCDFLKCDPAVGVDFALLQKMLSSE